MLQTHYRRHEDRPFTRPERAQVTLLYGGLTERHGALLGAAFGALGYRVEAVPTPTALDCQAGREFGNPGMCNPAYFTIGALVNHLRRIRDERGVPVREIVESYLFVTAGSCGPCRFGMYDEEFRLALRHSGFEGFRVIQFQEKGGVGQSAADSGLVVDARFGERFITCLMVGDLLNDLVLQIRPYETTPGQTERTFAKVLDRLCAALREQSVATPVRGRWLALIAGGLLGKWLPVLAEADVRYLAHRIFDDTLTRALAECAGRIDGEIEADYTLPKPVCKVTGEFWAQLTEGDGNFRIFTFLESEGAEAVAEPVMTWVNYLIDAAAERIRVRKGTTFSRRDAWKRLGALRLAAWLLNRDYERMRRALRGVPHRQIPQGLLRRLAAPFFNTHISGGEGHMEIGKTIYCATRRTAHLVISVKPFGCLPSTQSDGVQPAVAAYCAREGHPIAFVPIETSGDGAVHAYNRIQAALEDAKRLCEQEFGDAVRRTGVPIEVLRAYSREHPACRRPLWKWKSPEPVSVVGRAARFVTLLAICRSARLDSKAFRAWHGAMDAQ